MPYGSEISEFGLLDIAEAPRFVSKLEGLGFRV